MGRAELENICSSSKVWPALFAVRLGARLHRHRHRLYRRSHHPQLYYRRRKIVGELKETLPQCDKPAGIHIPPNRYFSPVPAPTPVLTHSPYSIAFLLPVCGSYSSLFYLLLYPNICGPTLLPFSVHRVCTSRKSCFYRKRFASDCTYSLVFMPFSFMLPFGGMAAVRFTCEDSVRRAVGNHYGNRPTPTHSAFFFFTFVMLFSMLIGGLCLQTCTFLDFLRSGTDQEEEGPVLSNFRYSGNFNHFFEVQSLEIDTNLVRNGYRRR